MIASGWEMAYLALATSAIVQSLLLTWFAFEQRRFVRSRLRKPVPLLQAERLVLSAPCKGLDLELEDNLGRLFEQDHPNFELRLIVEAADDPAVAVIQRLRTAYPRVDSRLVVAGRAERCGQKVHNLCRATEHLPPEARVLAFVDSDARPRPDWLSALAARLERSPRGAVTAYRWMVPIHDTWPAAMLASVNAVVASLLGPGGHHLVWGGAWAIRREVFDEIGLGQAWQETLSDDLVASRVLRRAGRPVEFEPRCMVLSPLAVSWGSAGEFLRRQYTIGKAYVPGWWAAAAVVATMAVCAFWSSLLLVMLWADRRALLPAAVAVALYGGQMVRAAWRQEQGRSYLDTAGVTSRFSARVDQWLGPLVSLFNWLCLAASAVGRTIVWRGIRYQMAQGGRVLSVERALSVARLAEVKAHPPQPQASAPHFSSAGSPSPPSPAASNGSPGRPGHIGD